MPLDNPQAGISFAAEFQSSALPWVTSSIAPAAGSPVEFDFPFATRFVSVTNLGSGSQSLSFGFTRAGIVSTNNKIIVNASSSITLELRVAKMWLQGETGTPSYSLCAGLTTVIARNFPLLSGTLGDGSSGWQGVG